MQHRMSIISVKGEIQLESGNVFVLLSPHLISEHIFFFVGKKGVFSICLTLCLVLYGLVYFTLKVCLGERPCSILQMRRLRLTDCPGSDIVSGLIEPRISFCLSSMIFSKLLNLSVP